MPGRTRGCDRRRGGLAQRVVQGDDTEERVALLDVVGSPASSLARGNGEHAEALAGPGRRGVRERVVGSPRGSRNDLGRALHVGAASAGLLVDDRHPLPLGVERQLVDELALAEQLVAAADRAPSPPAAAPPRSGRRSAPSALSRRARREHRCREELALVDAGRRAQRGDADPVLGQRAGLVGADDGRLAERLDRLQPAHDRAAPRHRPRAERERRGDGRGEPLGHGGDGDRDADEERLVQRLAASEHRRR